MVISSLYSLTSRLSAAVLKIIIYLYLAKVLTVIDYGQFSFLMTVNNIGAMFLLFGINHSILQVMSRLTNTRLKKKIIDISVQYLMILSVISCLLITGVFSFLFTFKTGVLLGIGISSQIIYIMVQSINLGENRMFRYILLPTIQLILFFILVLIIEVENSYQVIVLYSITSLIALLLIKINIKINVKLSLIVVKKMLSMGKNHLLNELNNVLIHRSDIIILKILKLDMLLGFYSIVKNVIEGMLYIPKSLQPIILREYNNSKKKTIGKINLVVILIHIFVLIVTYMCGEYLIEFFLGDSYLIVYEILILYLIGLIFLSIGMINSYMLLSYQNFKEAILLNFLFGIGLLIFNFIGIIISEKYGIGISFIICSLGYYVISKKLLKKEEALY
jgi:O-antigen/teichoic acid export membrane protein